MRKRLSILLIFTLIISSMAVGYAQSGGGDDNPGKGNSSSSQSTSSQNNVKGKSDDSSKLEDRMFKDVSSSFWAYEDIEYMSRLGIVKGFENGMFKPNQVISRAEFAVMMVQALNLPLSKTKDIPFADMKGHWANAYVAAAMNYLTGYNTDSGQKFKPDNAALREDMAVAMVKAAGYEIKDNGELANYSDSDKISPNLKSHVATAIRNGIMVGTTDNNKKFFNGKGMLTRAEAIVLLRNVRPVSDDDKIVLGENQNAPRGIMLTVTKTSPGAKLVWVLSGSAVNLEGFKIVASQTDSTPQYPDNGYLTYITDKSVRSLYLKGSEDYHGIVINGKEDLDRLVPGQEYYFAVTAVYKTTTDAKEYVTSNVVKTRYASDDSNFSLRAKTDDSGKIELEFNGNDALFSEYKITASRVDSTPSYPDDGYYKSILAGAQKKAYVLLGEKVRTDGTEVFESGAKYYFTVTGIAREGSNVLSNVASASFVQSSSPKLELKGKMDDGKFELEIESEDITFNQYILIASKVSTGLTYPEKGYYKMIPFAKEVEVQVRVGDVYNGTEFTVFEAGKTYYFKVIGDGTTDMESNIVSVTF